ncbi:hypothetical protein CLNEO_26640 [Anaerotignum neopropionicum]|uniref:DUF4330 domain-containing protein n=1 Tax=Anaerotignum neopropionicum TaxID=36847 RepID=A0A136WBS8_9FIRM|nr:DUF4330 domain-containing protein [Anaerotignum neopropionicum]KXL51965.1 hypothetical protein CLNEO_26640 [Anaerotignum neopropionicum]
MKKSRKLFGIFNIVDIILIFLVIAAGVIGVKLFMHGGPGGSAATKTYSYVVQGRQVLEETAGVPVIGEKVYNSSTAAYLGVVKKVTSEPYNEVIYSKEIGAYQKLPVEGYSDVLLTIEGSGTETEKDITVEGTTVKVGLELNVKGKGYAFQGIVVEVRDGE